MYVCEFDVLIPCVTLFYVAIYQFNTVPPYLFITGMIATVLMQTSYLNQVQIKHFLINF